VKRAAIVISVLCLIAIGFAIRGYSRGVTVVVRNVGDAPMQNVAVHVTGNSYELGTFGSGDEGRVRVKPSGESHVEISFIDANGQQQRLVCDCYFEPRHWHGTITIDVAGGQVVRLQDSVSIGYFE
jgi:hypothetical protein